MQEYSDDLMHIKTSAVMQQCSQKEMQKNTKESLRLNTPENLQRYLQKYLLVQNLQKETWVWTRIFLILILVHAVKSLRKLKANCCFVALKRLKQLREAQLNIIISLLSMWQPDQAMPQGQGGNVRSSVDAVSCSSRQQSSRASSVL